MMMWSLTNCVHRRAAGISLIDLLIKKREFSTLLDDGEIQLHRPPVSRVRC
jgi:hypothetical protein